MKAVDETMQAVRDRPHTYRQGQTALASHGVDQSACNCEHDAITDEKSRIDHSVFDICHVELLLDPDNDDREYLAVKEVQTSGNENQEEHEPTPFCFLHGFDFDGFVKMPRSI